MSDKWRNDIWRNDAESLLVKYFFRKASTCIICTWNLFFQNSYIFQIIHFFIVFIPFWGTNKLFGIMVFVLTKWEISMAPWTTATKESEPLQRRKFLCRSDPLQQREMPFVAVKQSDKGKLLCCSEPVRQQKVPMSLWTTALKENSYVAVNHNDKKNLFTNAVKHCKEGKTNLFWTKHKFWIKRVLWHKMGIKTKKNV